MKFFKLLVGLLVVSAITAAAEDPGELIRLREQFQARVKQQVQPLQKVYLEELVKLEKRLIKDNRLESALAVQKEREAFAAAGSDAAATSAPKTAEDLEKALSGTTWTIEAIVEGKPSGGRYYILLPGNKAVYSWNATIGDWKATAANKVEISRPGETGTMELKLSKDLLTWKGTWSGDAFERTGSRLVPPVPPAR